MSDMAHTGMVEWGQHAAACTCLSCMQRRSAIMAQVRPANPLEESLSAIRDAITSRDRHFDALGEQLKLGFSAIDWRLDMAHKEAAPRIEAILAERNHQFQAINEAFVALTQKVAGFEAALKVLGAQLEGIERHFTLGPSWTQGFTTAAKQYNLELTQHLKAILSQLTESKRPRKPAGRKKAKR